MNVREDTARFFFRINIRLCTDKSLWERCSCMIDIHKMTIKEIKDLLTTNELSRNILKELAVDQRNGVRVLLQQYERMQGKKKVIEDQWQRMTIHEQGLRNAGIKTIAGVDEVGRGPLAGPVVAAAVVLPDDFYLPGLNDSKKLSIRQREEFYEMIVCNALDYSISFADAEIIDEINIHQATMKVIRQAVSGLHVSPEICLVDGLEVSGLGVAQKAIVGGDGASITIAAASVIAKVTRDRWMNEAALRYPAYGFERNAGYGTPDHLRSIGQHGPCPLHRQTFAGVKEWISC
jgi:ribonuclease HII